MNMTDITWLKEKNIFRHTSSESLRQVSLVRVEWGCDKNLDVDWLY